MYKASLIKKIPRIMAAFLLVGAQIIPYVTFSGQKALAAPGDVRICHADENENDPYQSLTVSPSAVDGVGNGDHLSHIGPLVTSSSQAAQLKDDHIHWGDIIPPVANAPAGLNWTTIGQAIYNAGCSVTTVEVKKVVVPAQDSGLFNLAVEGTTYATNVGNGGTTGAVYINDRDDITIAETAGTATSLNSYSTSLVCKNNNGSGQTVETGNPNHSTNRNDTIDSGDIDSGDRIVCIFTNTRLSGTLNVVKTLNQNNGGNKIPSDFQFTVSNYNNGNPINFEDDGTNALQLPVGSYTVTEISEEGYTASYDGCAAVEVTVNASKTCTITNTSNPAYLTVTKAVQKDNGGDAIVGDFILTVNGEVVDSGDKVQYHAGVPLSIDEEVVPGYEFVSIAGDEACPAVLGGEVTLQPGDDISCVITNTDIAPVLTIIKNVTNDNGGTLTGNDFGIKIGNSAVAFSAPEVNGATSTYTSAHQLTANNTYTISEQDTAGYAEGNWNCTNSQMISMFSIDVRLREGDDVTCTVTNNDQAPSLALMKFVVSDFGGSTPASAWTLIAQNGEAEPVINQPGNIVPDTNGSEAITPMTSVESGVFYTLSESNGPLGYQAGIWSCEGGELVNGAVKLMIGAKVVCSITNSEIEPVMTVVKYATNDNGGETLAEDFTLYVNDNALSYPSETANEGALSRASYEITMNTGEDYTVSEEVVNGYENTLISCLDVTNGTEGAPELGQPIKAVSGMKVLCEVYNDDIAPQIHVTKYARGAKCLEEPTLNERESCYLEEFDFTLMLDEEDYDEFSLVSGEEYVTDEEMQTGIVEVVEDQSEGWFLEAVECYTYGEYNMMAYLGSIFETAIGQVYYCDFYNEQASEIIVTKFHDYDEDGEWDEGEPVLPDWEMTVDKMNYCDDNVRTSALRTINEIAIDNCESQDTETMLEITNDDGEATFNSLHSGRYTVDEVLQEGWVQSSINCENGWDSEVSRVSLDSEEDSNSIYVYPGQTAHCYIGNYREPTVTIEKTNSTTGPVLRGTEITFKIVVTVPNVATSGILHGTYDGTTYIPVIVNDGFTNEFQYITGSFTASSTVRGDLKVAGIVTDPNYASPGTWNLTSETSNDIVPGEVITLTYKGIVEATAPASSYTTAATVTGYGDDITVSVTDTDDDKVVVHIPAVLGSSTTKKMPTLVSTGDGVISSIILGTSLLTISLLLTTRTKKLALSQK